MNSYQETVGSLIERLFPKGFMNGLYILSVTQDDVNIGEAISKLKSIDSDKKYRKRIRKRIDESKPYKKFRKWTAKARIRTQTLNEKRGISAKYQMPPICPFDMFALTSMLLAKSGAYRYIEKNLDDVGEPLLTQSYPTKTITVSDEDIDQITKVAEQWYRLTVENKKLIRSLFNPSKGKTKKSITDFWLEILDAWDQPVFRLFAGNKTLPDWWKAAYSLMAIADDAGKDTGFKFSSSAKDTSIWAVHAELIITEIGKWEDSSESDGESDPRTRYVETLSLANGDIVSVMPKSKTAPLGCTLRSLSHNLANLPGRGTIRTGWAWTEGTTQRAKKNSVFNLLLIPYPYDIHSTNFLPSAIGIRSTSQSSNPRWGKFHLKVEPNDKEDAAFIEFVEELVERAEQRIDAVHGIVLPELAISKRTLERLQESCINKFSSVELLVAGLREHPFNTLVDGSPIPANCSYMATFSCNEDERPELRHNLFHSKHHRWRLTDQQVRNYDLSPTLDPSLSWWEDIRLFNRRLPFVVMRDSWSVTSLICEDLARNDPARSVIESVGPNLVISLLMDGPQTKDRWSARYATVLAEDPGSSVLSITSFGLIDRSNRFFNLDKPEKSFALWRDDEREKSIELDDSSHAVAISLTEFPSSDVTMDGRVDNRSVSIRLTGVRQISAPSWKGQRPPWGSTRNPTKNC